MVACGRSIILSRTVKAGYLAIAQGIGSCMAIVVAAVLSRQLEPADYATYRQTILTYRFLAPLLLMGLPQAAVYFISREDSRVRGILIEIIGVLLLAGSVFFLFLIVGGNGLVAGWLNNPGLRETLIWFAPYALFILPASALNTTLTACGRPQWAAMFSIATQLIFGVLIVALVYYTGDVVTVIKGVVAHSLLICVGAFYLLYKISLNTSRKASLAGVKNILAYSVPLGIGSAIAYLNINLDKVIVARFVNPSEFAVYVNGAFEVPLIGMLTGAASAIILPDMIRSIKAGNGPEALGLWKRAAVKSAALLFPITAILWVMAPEIMVFLFGAAYESSAEIFRVYILLVPIRIGFFGVIYQACGKSKLLMRRSLLAVTLNLITTIPLTMLLGPVGAALSTVLVSWVIMVPYNAIETSRLIKVKTRDLFAWKDLSKITLSSLVLLVLLMIINQPLDQASFGNVWIKVSLMGGFAVVGALTLHLLFGVWSRDVILGFVSGLYRKFVKRK